MNVNNRLWRLIDLAYQVIMAGFAILLLGLIVGLAVIVVLPSAGF